MSIALARPQSARRRYRLRRGLTEAGSAMLGVVLLIWSLLPVYNMLLIALDPEEGEVYLYTQYEPADARRVFADFEQPDLKAPFRFEVRAQETSTAKTISAPGITGGLAAGISK